MINQVWLGWTRKSSPQPISFMGQTHKIRFGDVKNFGFQILKGYSRTFNYGLDTQCNYIWEQNACVQSCTKVLFCISK
jgi:hypothetical protein